MLALPLPLNQQVRAVKVGATSTGATGFIQFRESKNEDAQKRPCDGTRSHGEVPAEIAADIGPAVPLKSHTSEALT